MNFKSFLIEQFKLHPSMQSEDVIKMCYQAAFGAEHLLDDLDKAFNYLEKEYEEVSITNKKLYEQISNNVCRINLSAWKERNLSIHWLFKLFVLSCKINENGKEEFEQYLKIATDVINSINIEITPKAWNDTLIEYRKLGMPPIHHSDIYKMNEKPSYRIVNQEFLRVFPILEKVNNHLKSNHKCIIAIDGKASSGKTTLSKLLQTILDASIIHMDDFFLPSNLRTKERFNTPGSNIHYERFIEEVLPNLTKNESFSYKIFDCSKMEYGDNRTIDNKNIIIVEGSYSHHPIFKDYADIYIFLDISKEEQIKRIEKRNGLEMLQIFLDKWIPLEEEYFKFYNIKNKANIII